MSVAQNMSFSLRLRQGNKNEIEKRVAEAAGILGLSELLDRRPRELSGGQRQRVAMGRAIVRDPKVFLFDEPLSNLDAKLRVQMRTEIKALHQRLKTTTIYVTHDQVEAMTMADKIVVMNAGQVEQTGSPLKLYDQPANMFVAGFIGSPGMNMIDGTLVAGNEPHLLTDDGLHLPLNEVPAGYDGHAVTYGVRPEHLALDGPRAIDATIEVLEPTGSETQVFGQLGTTPVVGVFRERIALPPGAAFPFAPDLSKVHLFDRATGMRIN